MTAFLAVMGAACQPLPQPFAHEETTVNLAAVPTSEFGGITILSISGMSNERSVALSRALADVLVSRDILAGPGSSNSRSKFVQGTASVRPLGQQRTSISIVWDLFDPGGKLLGSRTVSRTVPTKTWQDNDVEVVKLLANGAGKPMADLIRKAIGDNRTTDTITLFVRAVDGVSRTESNAFRRAMTAALKRRKFSVSDKPDGARLSIAGRLKLGAEKTIPRSVEITWSVLDRNRRELGKLTQRNTVTARILKSGWTGLAGIIAESAAGGVSDLVLRLPPEALERRANMSN